MLEFVDEGLYYAEDDVTFYGCAIQTRMFVVMLPDASLLVISPLLLTKQLKNELDTLGPVRHVASPNKIHNQGLDSFAQAYPDAQIWASPGLVERRPEQIYAGTLDDEPHEDWAPVLDQLVTKGNIFFSEVVFFHPSSKSLIVADLVENISSETVKSKFVQFLTKAARVFGKPMPSPEFRMYTTDTGAARRRLDAINAWDFNRILMAHGTIITEQAHDVLSNVRDFLTTEVTGRSQRRAAIYKYFASRQ